VLPMEADQGRAGSESAAWLKATTGCGTCGQLRGGDFDALLRARELLHVAPVDLARAGHRAILQICGVYGGTIFRAIAITMPQP